MIRQFLKFAAIVFLLLGCEKTDLYLDPNYPTSFNKLPTDTLSRLRSSLSSKYQYLRSTLNDYGFCYLPDDYIVTNPPSLSNSFTESDAMTLANIFISDHPFETGIQNPEDLTISRSYSLPSIGVTNWTLVSSYQKVDTIEVLYTEIVFRFQNSELINCEGNWYPNIYIPNKFNFNENSAKIHLVDKKITHYDIGGDEYYVTITKTDIDNSTADLKIVPIIRNNKIELRVTWMVHIPGPVFCKVYVDVMSGEIIKQAWNCYIYPDSKLS
jgi:hypothetical protein